MSLQKLHQFLAKTFEGHVIADGQCLASSQFEKRVFKFEIKKVSCLDENAEYARITPKTVFTCECHPKSKDVVEQIPASPRSIEPKDKVPLADLEALITAYHRIENIKPGGVEDHVTRPYDQVLDILRARIEAIWEQEVGATQKKARIEYVPGTTQSDK